MKFLLMIYRKYYIMSLEENGVHYCNVFRYIFLTFFSKEICFVCRATEANFPQIGKKLLF